MIDVWELTRLALVGLGWPLAADQYLTTTAAALPEQYLVYQLISSPPEMFADNVEKHRSYRMQVNAYSRSGFSALPNVAGAMATAGFAPGPMRSLPYNPDTRHYGLVMEFVYSS